MAFLINKELSRNKHSTLKLKSQKQLYDTLVANLPYSDIYILDEKYSFLIAQGTEMVKYGINPDILKNKKLNDPDLLENPMLSQLNFYYTRALSGLTVIEELNLNNTWYELRAVPLKDENSKIYAVLAIVINIYRLKKQINEVTDQKNEYEALYDEYLKLNTELETNLNKIKNINVELKNAKNKAEEHDRLKSAFLHNMSHEIRTPLNGLIGFSDLLSDDENLEADKKKEYIQIIRSSGEQLIRIIDDLIDISQIETGQVSLIEEEFNLNPLLDNAFLLIKKQIKDKKKPIQLKLFKGLKNNEDAITADKTRLLQVILNLLSNSVKYTKKGSIEIGYRVKDNHVEFYVNDTGIGIPEESHEVIFERFRQAYDDSSHLYGGTGLGLAISKGLIKMMNGTISMTSKPGTGSTFKFSIPYNQGYSEKKPDNQKASLPVNSHKTILIAEDVQESFELLKEYLKGYDIKILHAMDGLEAVELALNQENPDLILMDIRMPEMSGITALKEIKKIKPELPVIIQTAYAMQIEKDECFKAGCDDYLTKPIDKASFFTILNKYLKY